MTNLELQAILKELPPDLPIFIPWNCGMDDFKECENAENAPVYINYREEVKCIILRNFEKNVPRGRLYYDGSRD